MNTIASVMVGLLAAPLAAAAPGEASAGSGTGLPHAAAVSYQVPREAPTAEVQVLSLGAADLPVANLIGTERHVHIRLAAINRDDDRHWVLDARDQRLKLADGRVLAPAFATASTGARPARIGLGRGQRGYLDLFFSTEADPRFTAVAWRLRRERSVTWGTTLFERLPSDEHGYAHYRPAQYGGGTLILGSLWCGPWWNHGWIGPYWLYDRYHYEPLADGYSVRRGRHRWSFERENRPIAEGERESVGGRWRRQSRSAEPVVIAPPASATSSPISGRAPAVSREWTRFRDTSAPGVDDSSFRSSSSTPQSSSFWQRLPFGGGGSASVSKSWTWSSSSGSSSSSSTSTSSSAPSPPPAPSPTPAASSSPPPSPSPPASNESVGSRWRSR